LPTIDDDWKSLASNRSKIQSIEKAPAPKTTEVKPYNSFGTIGFDYWSPWFTASEDGVMGGFSAHFSDPAQFQNLYLVGGAESEYGTPIGALIYQYSGLYPIFTLYGLSEPETYTDLVRDDNNGYYDYDEEVRTAGISVSLPLLRVDWQSYFTLGYEVSDRSVINESADEYRGRTLVTKNLFDGTECSLWSQVNFFNGTAFGRSHSVEDGRYLAATVQWSDESLGSDIDRTRVRGDWHEYITLPWSENHVLKLEGTYAIGSGDKSAQGLFGLGGYMPSLTPVPGLDRTILLRGYSSNYQVGDEVVKAGAAYRFPIYQRYRNVNTTSPFYIHQLFGEVFYEGGKATGGDIAGQDNKWLNAAGLELNVSTTLFRFLPISPGIGVAYAFDREDRNRRDNDDNNEKWQFYISIKTTVNF
jgi:outer membrane protein assembly factor BamA